MYDYTCVDNLIFPSGKITTKLWNITFFMGKSHNFNGHCPQHPIARHSQPGAKIPNGFQQPQQICSKNMRTLCHLFPSKLRVCY